MMFMISVLVYVKRYPNTEKGIMAKISEKINAEYQKIFNNYNNLFKEIHKTLLTSKGIWLIAAAIFAAVYFSTTGYVTFNDLQIQNDKLYKEHGGKDYTYIKNYVDSVLEKTDNANKERIEAQKKYDNGEIDFEEYFAAVSNYNSVSNSSVEIAEPMEKLSYLAKLKKDVTIITNSAYIAIRIRELPIRKVILLGGEYQKEYQGMVGPLVRKCAKEFYVDKFFVGTDGFIPDAGFTCDDLMRVETMKYMEDSANRMIILADSSKFSQKGVVIQTTFSEIDTVCTDAEIPEDALENLKRHNINVEIVE